MVYEPKEYIETEYKGETVRQYADDSLRRPDGTLVTRHPKAATVIDKDLALELNQRRWDAERAKREQERLDTQRAVKHALVSQVAGAKSVEHATEKLAGHLVAELDADGDGSVKEHGVKNYSGAIDWLLLRAGLIKDKASTEINITKQELNVSAGSNERIEYLLTRLAGASGEPQTPGDG